ncbi:hypothetical protein EDD16DRAFT_1019352 [Pisolithus croceorrhizus]|nr:hypothetical protein EDD16DRAFT_1019352 [Pisolithus croceorrhizus]
MGNFRKPGNMSSQLGANRTVEISHFLWLTYEPEELGSWGKLHHELTERNAEKSLQMKLEHLLFSSPRVHTSASLCSPAPLKSGASRQDADSLSGALAVTILRLIQWNAKPKPSIFEDQILRLEGLVMTCIRFFSTGVLARSATISFIFSNCVSPPASESQVMRREVRVTLKDRFMFDVVVPMLTAINSKSYALSADVLNHRS